jgi:hypothetical protein
MSALTTRQFWLGLLVAIVGFWVALAGAMWVWGGMSTIVGDMSGTCEHVTVKYFGPGTDAGQQCFAQSSQSPLGISGVLAGFLFILVGAAIIAAACWILVKATELFGSIRAA